MDIYTSNQLTNWPNLVESPPIRDNVIVIISAQIWQGNQSDTRIVALSSIEHRLFAWNKRSQKQRSLTRCSLLNTKLNMNKREEGNKAESKSGGN